MRLVELIIQATYCLKFYKDGDETVIHTSPPPLQCLKTLVLQQFIKQKSMELYLSLQKDSHQNEGNLGFIEPDHDLADNHNANHDTSHGEPTGQIETERRQVELETKPVAVNTFLKQLLQCKKQLDRKMDRSLDTLKQTAAALEGYRDLYSKTIDRLCEEAQAPSTPETHVASDEPPHNTKVAAQAE